MALAAYSPNEAIGDFTQSAAISGGSLGGVLVVGALAVGVAAGGCYAYGKARTWWEERKILKAIEAEERAAKVALAKRKGK